MEIDWVRQFCLALPHATENVQWDDDLCFKVAGKLFAIAALEPGDYWLSFKCTPETYAELIEQEGIVPAPYMARASWVSLTSKDALPREEIKRLIRTSYDLVYAKLPKKMRAALGA